jgi:hypothetical protein
LFFKKNFDRLRRYYYFRVLPFGGLLRYARLLAKPFDLLGLVQQTYCVLQAKPEAETSFPPHFFQNNLSRRNDV